MMIRLLTMLMLLIASSTAWAHKPSDSYLTLHIEGQEITAQWDIALRDLDFAIGLDADGDGQLTWDEVRSRHDAIAAYALSRLALTADGALCPLTAASQLLDHHTDGSYTVLRMHATCAAAPQRLTVSYRLFAGVDAQHRGLLRIEHQGATTTGIVGGDQPALEITLAQPAPWRQFADYVQHGIWHIWIGYDHILFLLSLLLPAVLITAGARGVFMDVLKIVSAFTLAHSITLSLAALQVVSLPSRWVESAIAASVAIAAANNLVPIIQGKRWLAAFVFGLVHGFGFASVLADLGLPRESLVLALVGFNAGVEVGQLAIVAAFLPIAYAVRATWLYRKVLLTGGSSIIVLVAAFWFAERI
jgi:hypothetical protein